MPKLSNLSVDDVNKTLHGFQYTNVSMNKLGATEYTIVQMVTDSTGSVSGFKSELENMLKVSVEACKKSPRADNLLYRTTAFSSGFGKNIEELHGFSLLNSIDPNIYQIDPDGGTPLYDATLEAVEALYDYGKKLFKQKFLTNAILFVLTDGEENASTKADPDMIKKTVERIRKENILESIRIILIGVNDKDSSFKTYLKNFKDEAGLDEYISIGDATPGKLAKLAQFVSQSVSSTSQALGSGGPSQPVAFKF